MNFKPSPNASTHKTHLWGYVKAHYHELVAVFGKPHHTQLDKGTVRWVFQAEDGRVFTMYDHNEDDMAPPPVGLYDWHIGSHDMVDEFMAWANEILDKQRKETNFVSVVKSIEEVA